MTRPKLTDVWAVTVTLLPTTRCEPPPGEKCGLQHPTTRLGVIDAKRHAQEHPGHLVIREITARTQYHVDPAGN
jgi:hypothetical protein